MKTLRTIFLALTPFWLSPAMAHGQGSQSAHEDTMPQDSAHLSARNTIGDVIQHPSLKGFAPQILPWDGRSYDEGIALADIGVLLPYHSNVDTGSVLGGINRMVDDIAAGRKVFYDFYSDAEKREQAEKANTGLFFFRGKPGAPFAVVVPGGGFAYVGSVHEGFPYALEINKQGYNVFVLRYRAGRGKIVPNEDLAAALSFIFENREILQVDTAGYSLWGSSAGARIAASIGSHGVAAFGGRDLPKPATVVMAYTAHTDRSNSEPPTFAVVGSDDGIAPPYSMESRINELRKLATPVEYRNFPSVGHGFGTGVGTSAEGWVGDATRFWTKSRQVKN